MRIGVKPGQWGWTFDELLALWARAEEAGFDLISCFDHVSSAPAGLAAWDAPTLLAAMSGATSRTRLAVHVLNASLRPPLVLAGQLAVAQAASGGRVEVGLGTGSWHLARHDHRVAGVPFPPFPERVRRLEACCRAFPNLGRGDVVSDDVLGLYGASVAPIGIDHRYVPVRRAGTVTLRLSYLDRGKGSFDINVRDPITGNCERVVEVFQLKDTGTWREATVSFASAEPGFVEIGIHVRKTDLLVRDAELVSTD